jgi:hypothetical protein
MLKTIYYALMLFCALLTVIVTAFAIQAAVNGHPIAYVLLPIIVIGAWVMYDDAMSIIQEMTE